MKLDRKNLNKYLLIFASLLLVTIHSLLRDDGLATFLRLIKGMDMIYIYVGVLCGLLFVVCESINLRGILYSFGYKINISNTLKYAFVGFFFSSVTPSASGGQPMQVYYMKKDDIKIVHSTSSLLAELAIFQFVALGIGMISFLLMGDVIATKYKFIMPLLGYGVCMHILVIAIVLIGMFKAPWLNNIAKVSVILLSRINIIKEVDKVENSVMLYIEEFKMCAEHIKSNPVLMLRVTLITCIQLLIKYSIPYWVYRGLGYSQFSMFNFMASQAILSIAVSSLPLPGGIGISEGGFTVMFAMLFPSNVIKSAALMSRGLGFYFVVLISLMVTIIGTMKENKIKRSIKYEERMA